ncbi:F0F1 ATP synthase subunit A [Erysipelatoclostridium sp. An173]|uniref:F0F1 ATP synthase subunit A n=1 Tax=Erysipelatoclostridium sp. An173 TaxID=1965571 RepID=UPI000B3A34AF|nr:F0F1 ATP synthase subunit A [Erysipelatoclostridium sp. An173]OUP75873.1 F0F1 ATP synthase subunit A [Erysipelatoclostridium sp. An173]
MGDIHIVIQPELIFSLIIMTVLSIFFILAGRKIKAADSTKRPTGIVLVCETGVKMIQDYMATLMPAQFSKNYYPYFAMMFIYIFISNISGLFGFEAPTSNYSITLAITIITFTLIQYNALKTKGVFTYIKDIIWPPTNILGTLAPLISLSMRLFGNIVAGSILLSLIYSFTGYLSEYVINFNFLGPLIAPIFHAYFDVFAGFIQTLVFVTLSSILIALEVNED